MTIAVSLKVHDGLVLAADSASTLIGNGQVITVYNSANKIVNLRKGLPIGFMTWGAGSIGHASIATLAKDLRRRFAGLDPAHKDWTINPSAYTIEDIANRTRHFFFDEHYQDVFGQVPDERRPGLGLLVGGYSAGDGLAEDWLIDIEQGGRCNDARRMSPQDACNVHCHGEPEPIQRLIMGFGTGLPQVLRDLGTPEEQVAPAIEQIRARLQVGLFSPSMPIQDAIDFAEFLVYLTVMWSRFTPGAATVGGPVEIAAITKHEGFKWVKRKFYFDRALNPDD